MARILSYGSLNLDLVYQVPHFVQAGETLSSASRTVHCGGKGLNQSIAAARAGGAVSHAGRVGRDGAVLTDALRDSSVDTAFVSVGDGPSGHAVIQVDPAGQNCILLFGGSNQEITHEETDRALEHFQAGDYLILQNEINGLPYIMEQAARRGMRIVFNPSPIDEHIGDLPLDQAWLLIFNEIEGAALAGCSDETEILDTLRRRWPRCRLLLTLGSRGHLHRLLCGLHGPGPAGGGMPGPGLPGGGHRRVPSRRGAVYSGDRRGALVFPSAGGVMKSKKCCGFWPQHFSDFRALRNNPAASNS